MKRKKYGPGLETDDGTSNCDFVIAELIANCYSNVVRYQLIWQYVKLFPSICLFAKNLLAINQLAKHVGNKVN